MARALKELGQTLLNHFRSLRAIDAAPISELSKIERIGPLKQLKSKHRWRRVKGFSRKSLNPEKINQAR